MAQDKRLKERFHSIPSLDELRALEAEGYRNDVILVETEKDKKLSMLKQLILTLVKGLSSNPAAIIKKIAGLVRRVLIVIFLAIANKYPLFKIFNCFSIEFHRISLQILGMVFQMLISYTMRLSEDVNERKDLN